MLCAKGSTSIFYFTLTMTLLGRYEYHLSYFLDKETEA